jgi:hypothetical protein
MNARAIQLLVLSGFLVLSLSACDGLSCLTGDCPDEDEGGWHPPENEYLGDFRLVYYWQAREADHQGEKTVALTDKSGTVLATVSEGFAEALTLEGTGLLEDGRLVGLHGPCSHTETAWCFRVADPSVAPYGEGAWGPLSPFRSASLASYWDLRRTSLYIPALKGVEMPTADGQTKPHDGCLIADDFGWSLTKKDIDFFILDEKYHQAIIDQIPWDQQVEVYANSSQCPGKGQADYFFFPL